VTEPIYLVDPTTKNLTAVQPVSFSAIGIKERQDLEEWVINHPQVLGEDLLILTSEFSGFDLSKRRLDVLALDKDGSLVVIELKLDAAHSLADQQAIRYAAFCSTMTMQDAADALSEHATCSKADAAQQILDFVDADELPELDDRPRVMLAAGAFDDQELTSTVLWLRTFGIDISCVELTPFSMPGGDSIVLVPKTIIPLPEAKEYLVRVEKKSAAVAEGEKKLSETYKLYLEFWTAFKDYCQANAPHLTVPKPQPDNWLFKTAGRNHIGILLSVSRQKNRLGCELNIGGKSATKAFHLLEQQKQDIEQELGQLQWLELPNKQACRIVRFKESFDVTDVEAWKDGFSWLKDQWEQIQSVFGPRVKALPNLDDDDETDALEEDD